LRGDVHTFAGNFPCFERAVASLLLGFHSLLADPLVKAGERGGRDEVGAFAASSAGTARGRTAPRGREEVPALEEPALHMPPGARLEAALLAAVTGRDDDRLVGAAERPREEERERARLGAPGAAWDALLREERVREGETGAAGRRVAIRARPPRASE
jgi:hypothetical protein